MRISLIVVAAIFTAFPRSLAVAQQVQNASETDRVLTTCVVADAEQRALAAVTVHYGRAEWRADYDTMIATLQGSNYMRLGKGWWTTLETIGVLEIGGIRLDPGSYYLGLAGDENGAVTLLAFDSKQAMKARLLPSTTALYRGEGKPVARAPLSLAKDSLPKLVEKLTIEVTANGADPQTGRLAIRWGRHELSAPMRFDLERQ